MPTGLHADELRPAFCFAARERHFISLGGSRALWVYIASLSSLRSLRSAYSSRVVSSAPRSRSASFNRWQQTFSSISVPIQVPGILTGTAIGPLFRYNEMLALRGIAHKYFGAGMIQPYVGFGIGLVWSYAYQQIADLSNSQNSVNFIVSPEVGAMVTLASGRMNLALNVAFRYMFTRANPGRTTNAQTIGPIRAGVVLLTAIDRVVSVHRRPGHRRPRRSPTVIAGMIFVARAIHGPAATRGVHETDELHHRADAQLFHHA